MSESVTIEGPTLRAKRGRATGPATQPEPEQPAPSPTLPNYTSDHQIENAIRAKVRETFKAIRGRYGVSQETALKAAAKAINAELSMIVDDEAKEIAEPWKPVGRLPGM